MNAIRALATFTSRGQAPCQEDYVLGNQEKGVFVVADGFGGHGPGAAAAQASCEAVRNYLVKEAGDLEATMPFVLRSYFSLAGNVLFNALVHANRKVTALNKGKGVHERGGASVVAGFVDGDLVALANVGSCSAWLIREGGLSELVVPRSYGRLVDPFSQDVAPECSAPLMAIGMAEDLEPEIAEYRVKPGDWLLLQTDGVSAAPREALAEVQKRFREQPESRGPEQAAVEALGAQRYDDNAAVSLVIF